MTKRLSLLFISLIFLSTLVAAFHHHDDGADHHDCPICVVHHQQANVSCTAPSGEIQRQLTETAYLRPIVVVVTKTFFTPANDRAPPA